MRAPGGRPRCEAGGTARAAGLGGGGRSPHRRAIEQGGDVFERGRPREEEALSEVAAVTAHRRELALGLDALGDHADAEAARDVDDRLDDRRRVLLVLLQAADERLIDLER